jgi:Raf kinase inhibitor-like YbhB/YbcL family protein
MEETTMLEKMPSSVGRALSGVRAGADSIVTNDPALAGIPNTIAVASPAFADNGPLPPRFTADGAGVSPPLEWHGAPPGTAELVLLIEDPDAPTPHPLVHAIAWKLRGTEGAIAEGALSSASGHHTEASLGPNSYLTRAYLPPDPPSGHGPHHYAFELFALDAPTHSDSAPGRGALIEWLKAHAIAKGMLTGTYERR